MILHHSFIAPINYLELVPETIGVSLVLAHLLENKSYRNFYVERQKLGEIIIMDNGAFEFKDPLELQELARICENADFQPDVIVAPDYPYQDYKKTINSAETFCKDYLKYFNWAKTTVMVVPQSKSGDLIGWLTAYQQMTKFDNVDFVGMSIMGIPNACKNITQTADVSFNRTWLTAKLINSMTGVNRNVKHHYLGCCSPREITMMKAQGLAYSNDSSTAFWHGICGYRFDDSSSGLRAGKITRPVDFNIEFNPRVIDNIKHNINWISKILGN